MGTKRHAILLIGALLLSQQGFAAEFTVDSTVDDVDLTPGDGVCATTTGQCTLRAAIQETNALNGADTINLPGGTYALTRPMDSSVCLAWCPEQLTDERGDLDITDDLTIIGSGPEITVIDASPILSDRINSRVLHIAPSATVELRGLLIRGGSVRGDVSPGGGGIFNAGVLTLRDCDVSGNQGLQGFTSVRGGGILNVGTLTLDRTTVHDNLVQGFGGGISNGGDLSMFGGALHSNHANCSGPRPTSQASGAGGGLFNDVGTATLSDVTIARNRVCVFFTVPLIGAGIQNNEGQLTMDNSTVSDNFEPEGFFEFDPDTPEIENGDQMTLNNVTVGELGLRNEGTRPARPPISVALAARWTGTLTDRQSAISVPTRPTALSRRGRGWQLPCFPEAVRSW